MRLFFYVEGQEEEMFVSRFLRLHLSQFGIIVQKPILAATSISILGGAEAAVTVGGVTNYASIHDDIQNYFDSGKIKAGDVLTTLVDLYALPRGFPGYAQAERQGLSGGKKAELIEQQWKNELGRREFFPYIQVHEFEALVLTKPSILKDYYSEHAAGIETLHRECAPYQTPEDINETKATSPSRRILKHVPNYQKTEGWRHLMEMGMPELKAHCPRFRTWIERCENFFQ